MVQLTMRRVAAIAGSAVFLVLAPGTLAVYVPWTFTRWNVSPPLLGFLPFRIAGAVLLALGLPVLPTAGPPSVLGDSVHPREIAPFA